MFNIPLTHLAWIFVIASQHSKWCVSQAAVHCITCGQQTADVRVWMHRILTLSNICFSTGSLLHLNCFVLHAV